MASSSRGEPPSSSNPSAETPSHFFKVILPATLQDKKLMIPEKFVRKFGDELSAVAKLTVPNGHAWHVGFTKDGRKMWFDDGWPDFVNHFSICVGYFLVFRYIKNSNFHVLIFDTTACEIQYPYFRGGAKTEEQNFAHHDEMKDDNSVEIVGFTTPNSPSNSLQNKAFIKHPRSSSKLYMPPSQPSFGQAPGINRCGKCGTSFKSPNFKHPNNPDSSTQHKHEEKVKMQLRFDENDTVRKRKVSTNERKRQIDAANAFEPSNPFCRVVMQPSYIATLCLPSCFSQKHLIGVSSFIKLQISDGKQWPVRCLYRSKRATLGQGWRAFILDNDLGEGDVCVFEVLRSRDIVLQVTVFRILERAEFVNRLPFGSGRGSNRPRKCVASHETPTFKHCIDKQSKKCKIEELDEINKSEDSELIKAKLKVEADSSDEENERTKFHELKLALLEEMGISVSRKFKHITAEEMGRATAAARLFKPKNPSFMVILLSESLKSNRMCVPIKFAKNFFSRDPKCIKIQDSDGREWPGTTTWYGRIGRCGYIINLAELIREKNLKGGDICIFELIKVEELLKVSVFYASSE
ncbi:hypothetical protein Ddye_003771 [Dipteronia dyeriana]|uniref:TF-B3 domain-containing protein n=1 Tax=Dipteronia dyeriana TaxID=168575 RepID=A0AAD9XTG3_9ROSI|nr:hypothetical protein Ddye_003771 [Dipteronia dyeriana]